MDLTDILAGLGIGIAAALTGGAAAAAAPAILGATAGAAGGAGALGLGALAGAATGAGLNAGKAAIKGDQDIGMAAAFGAGSGALGGLGGAAGAGNAAVTEGAGNVAAQNISTVAKDAITPGLTDSATQGLGNLAPTATQTNLLGDASKFITPDFATSTVPPVNDAGFAGLPADLAKSDQIMANAGKITGAAPVNFTNAPADLAKPSEIPTVEKVYNPDQKPGELDELVSYNTLDTNHTGLPYNNPNLANPNPSFGDAMSQSFTGLKDTVMNPGQHQGMLTAQLGMAGLEDSYKQQGLTEQAGAKQAADIVGQYRKAGIMPNELPKGLTDIANKRKSFAAGGTIRDVQGLGAIPSGYINQQSMSNFYPQSMIPQAQPLQSTQPIRHEVIGYAKGGEMKAQKQNENLGKLAEFLSRMRGAGNEYSVPSWVPLAGGTGAGDMMLGKTPEEIENWSYGNAPMQVPEMSNIPQFKRGRAQSFTDAITSLAPGVKATEGLPVGMSVGAPEKVVNAYKLFRTKANDPDTLYPLFVNADKPVPMNEWTPAEAGAPASQNADKVKSLLGPLAYRPGWHAGDVPVATHIGKGGKPPVYRPSEHTWAEVEFPNDVDWQSVANERGVNKNGILVPKAAHITDQIPEGGFTDTKQALI